MIISALSTSKRLVINDDNQAFEFIVIASITHDTEWNKSLVSVPRTSESMHRLNPIPRDRISLGRGRNEAIKSKR